MKAKKKLLLIAVAAALAVCAAVGAIAVNAADEQIGETGSVKWVLRADGTLTVTGTGELLQDLTGEIPYSQATRLIVGEGITGIGVSALQGNDSIQSVELPKTVEQVAQKAFANCTSLRNITFTGGIKSIVDEAFCGCTSLTSVIIPESVTKIGQRAFYGCSELKSVTINSSVLEIPNGSTGSSEAFSECTNLESVKYTNKELALSTGGKIFVGCEKLITAGPLESGCNVEYAWDMILPEWALADFVYLKTITIPKTITEIKAHAFDSLSLEAVTYLGTESGWNSVQIEESGNGILNSVNILFAENEPEPEIKGIELNQDNFPDALFLEYVANNIDSDKNGFLSEGEISEVKSIDVSGKYNAVGNITNIVGVQYFNNLNVLICEYNNITELDISSLTELTELRCGDNQISELNLENNKKLRILDCSSNNIESIDISDKLNLRVLDVSLNKLTELNVENSKDLLELYCIGNNLKELDVHNNVKLEKLCCGYNDITQLDISQNTKLKYLECYHAKLKELDASNHTMLTFLSCELNELTKLDVSNDTALDKLLCSNNKLTELDLSTNTGLTQLVDCSSNQLTKLDISNNKRLLFLYCTDNEITELILPADGGSLTQLACGRNHLDSLNISECKYLVSFNGDSQTIGSELKAKLDASGKYTYDLYDIIGKKAAILYQSAEELVMAHGVILLHPQKMIQVVLQNRTHCLMKLDIL